jgi:hypothetical protein
MYRSRLAEREFPFDETGVAMKRSCIETLVLLASALCLWQATATAQEQHHGYPGSETYREFATQPGDRAYLSTTRPAEDQVGLLSSAAPAIGATSVQSPAADCAWPSDVMGQFQQSVERGELVLFGRKLAWRDLKPVRIEYAYELTSHAKTVSVHSELIAAVALPEHDTMVVRRVAAVMADGGGIIESRMYVTPR